jgi:hypothetical protein
MANTTFFLSACVAGWEECGLHYSKKMVQNKKIHISLMNYVPQIDRMLCIFHHNLD